MTNILKAVLFVTAIILLFLIVIGIRKYPENDKKIRIIYGDAIEQLIDVRNAQALYKNEKGVFAPNFDSLNKFIEFGTLKINISDDSIVIKSVKDSIFKTRKPVKLGTLKTENALVKLHLKSDTIKNRFDTTGLSKTPVYKVWANKTELLTGMEQEIIDRDRINKQTTKILDDSIFVGNLNKYSDKGNWPNSYEVEITKKQKKAVKTN